MLDVQREEIAAAKNKKKKRKLTGPVIAKKTMFITGMHCEQLCTKCDR